MRPQQTPRLIVGMLYEGAECLDLVGPLEAFNFASDELRGADSGYEIAMAGPKAGPIETLSGIKIVADMALDDCAEIDTLLIPGARTGDERFKTAGVLSWLKQRAPKIRRIASICSGALVLADAGLLDGRRVTTHWMDRRALAARCPNAFVDADKIFVKDPPIYSSGGITAGIDLALSLVEDDHGRRIALKVAKRMIVFLKRQGGQAQFSDLLAAQCRADRFSDLIDWIEGHLNDDLSVARLANEAAMSPRNFSRKFLEEIGASPMEYVGARRLERAKQLLEETNMRIELVAQHTGFGSGERLRMAFHRKFAVSPLDYQRRFGPAS